jgi:membrane fusion protein (multidrug efflux system)
MNNKLFVLILSTLPAILSSCSAKKQQVRERPPVPVDVLITRFSDFPEHIEVNGSVLSDEMIELYPESSGRLTYLNMPDGTKISKGTVVARINDAELQAQLEQQKTQLELAIATEKRLSRLLEVNGVNQSDYDIALSQLNSLKASIKVLEAQIDKTIIKAPFDGTLGLRTVSPGAFVTPQTRLGTLQKLDNIKIDFSVPETYADKLIPGGSALIKPNNSEFTYKAVISAVEPQIDPVTRNMKARARLSDGTLVPGTFVTVILEKNEKRITVPTNAIIPTANSNQVIVIRNQKPEFRDIETGIRNAEVVEVINGINSGDSVVISGVLFVRPNSVLKVRSITNL